MPPLTPEQLITRQSFIGGSDAPAVCGVNPYKTAYQVFLEKTGHAKPMVETEAMYWGTIHEPHIITRFGKVTGRSVCVASGSVRHCQLPFIGAHLDARQRDTTRGPDMEGVVEVKTTRKALKKGECPEMYVIQLYHNMIAAGLTWGTVVILIQGSELVWYDYTLTKPIERAIVAIESKFWKAVEGKDWSLFGVD